MKKFWRVLIVSSFIILLGFTFRPIQNIEASQCAVAEGNVTAVFEGGEKDIVFKLNNRSGSYYVNRGMEKGLSLGALQDTLIGKPIKIWYVHNNSLLTFFSSTKHISRLDIAGTTAFNELVSD